MRTLNKIQKSMAAHVEGLNADIIKAEAEIESKEGRINKLEEEIATLRGEQVLLRLDIAAATTMRDNIELLKA
tara:strand:+ start:940 stop:1158 length:219 start_codon:yes stop_codon:yes gene_type:complete